MTQLSLIFCPPTPRSVEASRARGERAGNLSADKAEAQDDGFKTRAAEFILGYLAHHGSSSGELLTDAAKLAGIRPHDDRAFGPVYAKLLRDKRMRVVGLAPRAKGHGSAGAKVYELSADQRAV
jgi:hypothetical protein